MVTRANFKFNYFIIRYYKVLEYFWLSGRVRGLATRCASGSVTGLAWHTEKTGSVKQIYIEEEILLNEKKNKKKNRDS